MAATFAQMAARLVDIYGPPASAVPSKLYGNLMVAPSGRTLVGSTTDDGTGQLQVTGGAHFNGYATDTTAQLRLISGNYGTLFRNDGTTFYILGTPSGSAITGSFNSYRPFAFNHATGAVQIASDGSATSFGGSVTATTLQGTGATALISGLTGSGTGACCINYAGQIASWNGSNGWNSFYNILNSNGSWSVANSCTFSAGLTSNGQLSMASQLWMSGGNQIAWASSNGAYTAYTRADNSAMWGVINNAQNSWNFQVYDDGHVVIPRGVNQTYSTFGYINSSSASYFGGPNNTMSVGLNVSQGITCSQAWAISDRRVKTDITDITEKEAIEFVKNVKSKRYVKHGHIEHGFLAQDIGKQWNGLGSTILATAKNEELEEEIDDDGFVSPAGLELSVCYDQVIPIHASVLNNLLKRVESLEAQLNAMKGDSK